MVESNDFPWLLSRRWNTSILQGNHSIPVSESTSFSNHANVCACVCMSLFFFYHLHPFLLSRWIGRREQPCHPVISTLYTSMGAVQIHTWYSCSFLIIVSVRSLTHVELYFILNEWNKAHHRFVFGTLEGAYFPETQDRTLHIRSQAPTKSFGGQASLEEVRCLLLPSTQTCPLECPSQILPAIQDPSFHKQCLLIRETKLPTPKRPQAAQICFSTPSCKFLHGLGFWKLGHIIFLSFPSVCLSVSQTAFLILPASRRNFLW